MAAAAPATGKRKRDFSDDDVYLILHKYTPTTILTALQEVSQHAERRRIDWRALVAKTATGITSAREYQMLWRYFAYRHDFVELVDDSAQPLVYSLELFRQFQLASAVSFSPGSSCLATVRS
ncbi:hypothetical protein ACQ4PT_047997 [Festuca glaucescens]